MSDYLITYLNYGYKPFSQENILSTSFLCVLLCLPALFIAKASLLLKIAPWVFFAIYLILGIRLVFRVNMPRYCCYYHYALSSSAISLILISDAVAMLSQYYSNVNLLFFAIAIADCLVMAALCRFVYTRLKNEKLTVTGRKQTIGFFAIFSILGMAFGSAFFKSSSNKDVIVAMVILIVFLAFLIGVGAINFDKAYIIWYTPNAEVVLKANVEKIDERS